VVNERREKKVPSARLAELWHNWAQKKFDPHKPEKVKKEKK